MKTLLINGSPRRNGNTHLALTEVARTLKAEGIETEIFWLGNKPVRGCTACYACVSKNLGKCIFDDDVCNRLSAHFAEADAFVIGAPTYFGQPAGGFARSRSTGLFLSTGACRGETGCFGGDLPTRRFHGGVSVHEHAL